MSLQGDSVVFGWGRDYLANEVEWANKVGGSMNAHESCRTHLNKSKRKKKEERRMQKIL